VIDLITVFLLFPLFLLVFRIHIRARAYSHIQVGTVGTVGTKSLSRRFGNNLQMFPLRGLRWEQVGTDQNARKKPIKAAFSVYFERVLCPVLSSYVRLAYVISLKTKGRVVKISGISAPRDHV
jgi:hypothetical protein